MATITQIPARVIGTISGNSPMVRYYPEAASQSFKAGQFVYLNGGKVTICADDATTILGMAVRDASGTTDKACPVYIANPDTIFEANVYHSDEASAVTAITQVGTVYALQVDDTTGYNYVDIEDTTNKAYQVIDLSPKDEAGDKYGRVHFQVIDSVAQTRYDLDTDT